MIKRGLVFLLLTLIALPIFLTGIVSANVGDDIAAGITNFIEGVKTIGEPIFQALLGNLGENSEVFVLKILSFLLITIVIYGTLSVTNIFGEKGWINFAIGMIVSLIGIRFLPTNFLEAMAIPSSAFVATIVLLIPLVALILVGSRIENSIARKIFYVSYACVVTVLWFYNWNNSNLDGVRWLYPLIVVATLALLVLDGTLQSILNRGKATRTLEKTNSIEIDRIKAKIEDLQTAYANEKDDAKAKQIMKNIGTLKSRLEGMA